MFKQQAGETFELLWPTVAAELQAFAGLMLFLVSLGSCLGTGTFLLLILAKQVGESAAPCVSRHQWHLSAAVGNAIGICHPITSPLASQHFVSNSLSLQLHQDVRAGSPKWSELIEDPGFKKVPHEMFDLKDWETLRAQPCNHAEDIMLLEPVQFCGDSKRDRNLRLLVLCDNLGLTLAIERCRSRSYKVLMVIRRIAGLCRARNIRLSIRWKASETNPSDEP